MCCWRRRPRSDCSAAAAPRRSPGPRAAPPPSPARSAAAPPAPPSAPAVRRAAHASPGSAAVEQAGWRRSRGTDAMSCCVIYPQAGGWPTTSCPVTHRCRSCGRSGRAHPRELGRHAEGAVVREHRHAREPGHERSVHQAKVLSRAAAHWLAGAPRHTAALHPACMTPARPCKARLQSGSHGRRGEPWEARCACRVRHPCPRGPTLPRKYGPSGDARESSQASSERSWPAHSSCDASSCLRCGGPGVTRAAGLPDVRHGACAEPRPGT
jgi:hypothetical protein